MVEHSPNTVGTLCRLAMRREISVPPPAAPDEYRPERPILLAVDQQLGEGAALRVAPELSDPVGSVEVGEHQDVEQFGAGSRTEGVEALTQAALESVGSHGLRLRPARRGARCRSSSVAARTERTGWWLEGHLRSARWPERNLVRIHPNHAVLNQRCQSVETTRRGSDHVVSEAVELGAVDRVLEPRRRSAIVHPLAEMRAPRQECNRCLRRVGHDVDGHIGKQHDALGADITNRSDAHPSCARRPLGKGSNNGEAEEERGGNDEGDKERTSPRRRFRRHLLMVPHLLTRHKVRT